MECMTTPPIVFDLVHGTVIAPTAPLQATPAEPVIATHA